MKEKQKNQKTLTASLLHVSLSKLERFGWWSPPL